MHHTRPNRARVALVWRSRSPFTLAATTGPRHPRMAGTARLVVLPLWVGPTTTTDWAVSAAMPAQARRTGEGAEEEAPGRGEVGLHHQRAEVASRGPARTAARAATSGQRGPRPATGGDPGQ